MPRLLLTNDDGVDAPGMDALLRATEGLGERRVVAPSRGYSACSHVVTTHKPIAVERRADGRLSIDGSPCDCVRLGLHRLAPGTEWVVSGINAGGNLGSDVHISGTVAAVREAVLHGMPGVAVSHYIAKGQTIDWEAAARRAAPVIRDLISRAWAPATFWNVNLPHVPPGAPEPSVVECPLDLSPLPLDFDWSDDDVSAHYRADYHGRARVGGSDVDVCFRGSIAVSLVRLG